MHFPRALLFALWVGMLAAAAARGQDCWTPAAWTRPDLASNGAPAGVEVEPGLAALAPDARVDLLVDLASCARPADLERLARFGRVGVVGRFLSVVQLLRVPVSQVAALAAEPRVARIEVDHRVLPALETSVRALRVRASSLYSPSTVEDRHPEVTGAGINIAILDTGVDNGVHVSLPAAKLVAGYDALADREVDPDDHHGHGTHVAGIALGIGRRPAGAFRGVAPGAGLVDVKVLDGLHGSDASVLRGIEKCIERREAWGIGVMILSLASADGRRSDGTDALSQAVNRAVREGIVVVVAAGNTAGEGIQSPAAADDAIAVAAADDRGTVRRNDDRIAPFSSRGPRRSDGDRDRDDERKPDIAAPGVKILSARHDSARGLALKSGTSFAAAHVAGLAALILQASPGLSPAKVKKRLLDTAQDFGPPGWDPRWGYGLVNGWTAVPSE